MTRPASIAMTSVSRKGKGKEAAVKSNKLGTEVRDPLVEVFTGMSLEDAALLVKFIPGEGKVKITSEIPTEPPVEKEHEFPGLIQYVGDEAKDLYSRAQKTIHAYCNETVYPNIPNYTKDCAGFGNGSFKGILVEGCPLRFALNSLMFSDYATKDDKDMLAFYGRALARAVGATRDKLSIDSTYLSQNGLDALPSDLQQFFEGPIRRRAAVEARMKEQEVPEFKYAALQFKQDKLDAEAAAEFEERMVREGAFKEMEYNDYVRNTNNTVKDLDEHGLQRDENGEIIDPAEFAGNRRSVMIGEASGSKL